MDIFEKNRNIWLLLAVELVIFSVLAYTFYPFTPDDGFIYLYGARQLANGSIPNYTPGEIPTNAFGSMLWLLLLVPPYLLNLAPLVWAKVIGLILLIATAALSGKILLRLDKHLDHPAAYAASFSLLCYPFAVACAVNVLDTMLAAFAIALALYMFIRCIDENRGCTAAGLAFGLLLVSRPDAFLEAAVLTAVITAIIIKKHEQPRASIGKLVLGLSPGIILLMLTAIAFSTPLANSAAAKIPGLSELLSLSTYKRALYIFAVDFSRDSVLFLIYLSLIPFWLLCRRLIVKIIFSAFSFIHLIIFLLVRDWMGIHRLYFPSIVVAVIPMLFVLFSLFEHKKRALIPLAIMAILLPMGYGTWKYYLGYNYNVPNSPAQKMGVFIAAHKLPGSYLLTCDMGVVPYYADIPAIDSNDAPICNRWRRRHLDDLNYIFNHEMDFIILVNYRKDGRAAPVFSINEKIAASRFFRENYKKIGVAAWRPEIEGYRVRKFAIGYGRYFHLYVSKRIWSSLASREMIVF